MKYIFILFFIYMISSASLFAADSCESCHRDFESSCNLTCADCHNSARADYRPAIEDHPAVIRNPSRPRWWREKCAACHAKEIENFRKDSHYSTADIIGQTRYLWGETETVELKDGPEAWLQLQKVGRAQGHSPHALVDNLLAKKCLACHFDAPGKQNSVGRKRPAGCAACHVSLDQKNGKPLFGHRFQKKPQDAACLTCHSGNRVGADYYGYFEHDYHNEYATPFGAEPQFGTYQHRLAADVHQQAGMRCIDCHPGKHQTAKYQKTKQCEDCHGGFDAGRNLAKPNVEISPFDGTVIAHKDFHRRVSCSACHAQWSYQDYGLHLFLDESNHYDIWQNNRWQGDAMVTNWLDSMNTLQTQRLPNAQSPNRLSGTWSTGLWYQGWTFRRWDDPPLGIGKNNRFYIIRPLYQYFITYVDSADNLWLDSTIPTRRDGKPGWNWDAYTPHSIGKTGRACESCHGTPKAAGLGIRQSVSDSAAHSITLPSPPIESDSRLLNKEERFRLLNKSKTYKLWRAKVFRLDGIEELFNK